MGRMRVALMVVLASVVFAAAGGVAANTFGSGVSSEPLEPIVVSPPEHAPSAPLTPTVLYPRDGPVPAPPPPPDQVLPPPAAVHEIQEAPAPSAEEPDDVSRPENGAAWNDGGYGSNDDGSDTHFDRDE